MGSCAPRSRLGRRLSPSALGLLALAAPAAAQPVISPPPAVAPVIAPPSPQAQVPALTPEQARIALEVLRAAGEQGLDPKAYAPEGLTDPAQATPAQMSALAAGLVRYAHDVRVGRLSPGQFLDKWALRPTPYNAAADLAAALAQERLKPWLDGLPPPYAGYYGLKAGLARYRQIAADGGWRAVPAGPPLALGDKGPRVAALRARLAAEDPQVSVGAGETFDKPLQAALQRAQRRFGLNPDGVAGPATLRELNQPVGQRILQIIANMERWRWLPPTMPATRVQVNSGAAIVTLFQDDRPVMSMKAVSGRPGDETPILASRIHSIVINPPWNVPSGIAQRELWPKERARPGYFARNGYRVIRTDGGGTRLQQASGDQSALGRFKFDFDNDFAVYLHDTPAKGAFELFERQASHGCVRLEKPRALADALLAGDPTWTPEAIDAQLATDKTVRAPLPEAVPVFILYWTAFAGVDGQMHFRSDAYGWDHELLTRVGVLGP